MKQYKFILASDIDIYEGWDIVEVIKNENIDCTRVIITKENKPIQDYIKLNEATNKQLIEELSKRLGGKDD